MLLEKAVGLARRFGARIDLVLHESLHAQAFATLCSALRYREVTLTSLHRGAERLHEAVLRCAFVTQPDLIMKAVSGEHPLNRWTCDENDYYLANASPVPLLLVRHKAWSRPTRFAAAVDVSDDASAATARSVLQAAGLMTLGCRGHIDILYSERERGDERARMARAVKLAQLVREFHVGSESIQLSEGLPESTLPPIVTARQYDVLVLGARSHRQLRETLFGTVTSRLVDATEGDVLLVNEAVPQLHARRAAHSFREQRPDESEQLR